MFISILGRQPEISIAELNALFGHNHVTQLSTEAAVVCTDTMVIDELGGSLKCGRVIQQFTASPAPSLRQAADWISSEFYQTLRQVTGKITLGISAYGFAAHSREVQKIGLTLKAALKKHGVSLRLIPNELPALSTATSHNNKLGLHPKKIELLLVRAADGRIFIATSCGAQNITSYTRRDRGRPHRDAFVGMLPPKLAQIMLNLALGPRLHYDHPTSTLRVLDPFCGTGTVLQEALLKGCAVYGTDLSQKMIDYSAANLSWLQKKYSLSNAQIALQQADARQVRWAKASTIDAVVCEAYLGQPFSAPPHPEKLREVRKTCDAIVTDFLKNLQSQLQTDTPLCIAVPAWYDTDGRLTHLPVTARLTNLGYHLSRPPLIYSRPDQVVAREILILKTTSRY